MKWHEVVGVPEGALLVRQPSGRKAVLKKKFGPPTERITVQWIDDSTIEERADPREFDRLKPSAGTVPRTGPVL